MGRTYTGGRKILCWAAEEQLEPAAQRGQESFYRDRLRQEIETKMAGWGFADPLRMNVMSWGPANISAELWQPGRGALDGRARQRQARGSVFYSAGSHRHYSTRYNTEDMYVRKYYCY